MKLITSMEELTPFLTNYTANVSGERSIFDKLQPYIENAEIWVESHVAPISEDMCYESPIGFLLRQIVACNALASAMAALDIIITPNGIGVVNTDTIAPASQHRTEAAVKGYARQADDALLEIIPHLEKNPMWPDTEQCVGFYGSTLLSRPSEVKDLGLYPDIERIFDRYSVMLLDVEFIEKDLAWKYVSPELLTALHGEQYIIKAIPLKRASVILGLRREIRYELKTGKRRDKELRDIVDVIRKNPDIFPEWHSSETSGLYELPTFQNKKKSSGYFF